MKRKHTGDVPFMTLVGQYMVLTMMLPTYDNYINVQMTLQASLEAPPFDRDELLSQCRTLEQMCREVASEHWLSAEAHRRELALWMVKAYLMALDERIDFKR